MRRLRTEAEVRLYEADSKSAEDEAKDMRLALGNAIVNGFSHDAHDRYGYAINEVVVRDGNDFIFQVHMRVEDPDHIIENF